MTAIETDVSLTALKTENSRLAARLEVTNKCALLLEKYRKCLAVMVDKCQCSESGISRIKFTLLEGDYQRMAIMARSRDGAESESGRGVDAETNGDLRSNKRKRKDKTVIESTVGTQTDTTGECESIKRVKCEDSSGDCVAKSIVKNEEKADCEVRRRVKTETNEGLNSNKPNRFRDEAECEIVFESMSGVKTEMSAEIKESKIESDGNNNDMSVFEAKRGIRTETNGECETILDENCNEVNSSELRCKVETDLSVNCETVENNNVKEITAKPDIDLKRRVIPNCGKPNKRIKFYYTNDRSECESIRDFKAPLAIRSLTETIKTENNGNDIVLAKSGKQCARDSFDRFDSYFCERVFTYLSVNDCFKCECVSKLWSSLVFTQKKRLDIGLLIKQFQSLSDANREIGLNILNSMTKKYCSIDEIIISCLQIDSRVIDIIRENVISLKSVIIKGFTSELSAKSWLQFCEKFGPNLQKFIIDYDSIPGEYRTQNFINNTLLQFTPNLIECQIERLNQCIRRDGHCEQFLPKLKSITARYSTKSDFLMFAHQYSSSVEKLRLSAPKNKEHHFLMFEQLSRFKKLESLYVEINSFTMFFGINLIANSCKNLRELTLSGVNIFENVLNIDSDYDQQFPSLTRMTIIEKKTTSSIKSLKYLKCFPNLVALELRATDFDSLNLNGIHLYAPKLQSFRFDSNLLIASETFRQLANLEHLVSLQLKQIYSRADYSLISDLCLRDLIYRCVNIRRIELPDVKGLKPITLNLLRTRAECNPKHRFLLRTVVRKRCLRRNRKLKLIRKHLPKILEFDFRFCR